MITRLLRPFGPEDHAFAAALGLRPAAIASAFRPWRSVPSNRPASPAPLIPGTSDGFIPLSPITADVAIHEI
jgi:hypothetical protein